MLYDAGNDPELLAEMTAGATKCFELNSLPPTKAAKRKALIRQLLGKTGENFEIRSPFPLSSATTATTLKSEKTSS